MEKPVTSMPEHPQDVGPVRIGKEEEPQVAVGLMCRHCKAAGSFHRIQMARSATYHASLLPHAPAGRHGVLGPQARGISELAVSNPPVHSFLWASGGLYSDFYIHNIASAAG